MQSRCQVGHLQWLVFLFYFIFITNACLYYQFRWIKDVQCILRIIKFNKVYCCLRELFFVVERAKVACRTIISAIQYRVIGEATMLRLRTVVRNQHACWCQLSVIANLLFAAAANLRSWNLHRRAVPRSFVGIVNRIAAWENLPPPRKWTFDVSGGVE